MITESITIEKELNMDINKIKVNAFLAASSLATLAVVVGAPTKWTLSIG